MSFRAELFLPVNLSDAGSKLPLVVAAVITRKGGEKMKKEQMVGTRLSEELVRDLKTIEGVEQSDRSTLLHILPARQRAIVSAAYELLSTVSCWYPWRLLHRRCAGGMAFGGVLTITTPSLMFAFSLGSYVSDAIKCWYTLHSRHGISSKKAAQLKRWMKHDLYWYMPVIVTCAVI